MIYFKTKLTNYNCSFFSRCVHCRAYHFACEKGRDDVCVLGVPGKSFLRCCQHGKVVQTDWGPIPQTVADLVDCVDADRSRLFFKSPRTINNCLAFGSWPIDKNIVKTPGRSGMYVARGTAYYKYDPCMLPAAPDKAQHLQVMYYLYRYCC